MKTLFITLASVFLCLSSVYAADMSMLELEKAGFDHPIRRELKLSTQVQQNSIYTHRLDLSALAFSKDSSWSLENMMTELSGVQKVFNGCGILIGKIDLIQAESYKLYTNSIEFTFRKGERSVNLSEISTALKQINTFRLTPTIYFVKNAYYFLNSAMVYSQGASQPEYWVGSAPESGAVLIPELISSDEYRNQRNSDYSTIAHELGHILLNDPRNNSHTSIQGNVMADSAAGGGGRWEPWQCERILKSPYIHKLKN